MTTNGGPSPIRRYASSVPGAGTVPVRVADTDWEYFNRSPRVRHRVDAAGCVGEIRRVTEFETEFETPPGHLFSGHG